MTQGELAPVDGAKRMPKIIGISGPTRAGKTTLSYGIARTLCPGGDRHMPRCHNRDRVERFLNFAAGSAVNGYCVSIIGQDSYYKTGSPVTTWDDHEAIDHQHVLEALEAELSEPVADLIVFEGFKAFWCPKIVAKLDILIWIRVKEETSKARRMRSNRKVTEEIFEEMWKWHVDYEGQLYQIFQKDKRIVILTGEDAKEKVLEEALYHLKERKIVDSNILTARERSRSRRRKEANGQSATQELACANRSCWFRTSPDEADGGYCCKKCHWRDVSGFKSGKNHDKVCGKCPVAKDTPRATARTPTDPYPVEEEKAEVAAVPQAVPPAKGIVVNPLFKAGFACANPTCQFVVSQNSADGNYCCKKCHWRHASQSKSCKKKHNWECAKKFYEYGMQRAPHRPPDEPYPVEEVQDGAVQTCDASG